MSDFSTISHTFKIDDWAIPDQENETSLANQGVVRASVDKPNSATVFDVLNAVGDLSGFAIKGPEGDLTAKNTGSIITFAGKTIIGTNKRDVLNGARGDDEIRGLGNNDIIDGKAGGDILRGGRGADTIYGGTGNDLLQGDGSGSLVTTSATKTLSNGEELAVSLSAPDTHSGTKMTVSGFLSRQVIVSEAVDLGVAIDISGSVGSTFVGSVNVGDRNGDGDFNTILDAEIAAFESLHDSIVTNAQLPNAKMTIFAFETSSYRSRTFLATEDLDGNGTADVLDYVRGLREYGATNFELPLQDAVRHFRSAQPAQKAMYFISDGGNNRGGSINNEVADLLALGVKIQSYGIGRNADEGDLDIVDDGINNGTTTIVTDPSGLANTLIDPGISASDIQSLGVYVNSVLVKTLSENDLVTTPFGLRYFEVELTSMRVKANDYVEIRAIADDAFNTVVSTGQTVENLTGKDKRDTLFGGRGADVLEGGAGNDTMDGGAGGDVFRGGKGSDTVSYENEKSAVQIDLDNATVSGGAALGDTFDSVENAIGSSYGDTLDGSQARNNLKGGNGNDKLFGEGGKDKLYGGIGKDKLYGGDSADLLFGGDGNRDYLRGQAGNDKLDGGKGNDYLFGGTGGDVFIFKHGYDVDRIKDFDVAEAGEKIDLRDFNWSFRKVKNEMTTVGDDTRINFGNGDSLIIEDTKISDFTASDFIL